MAEELIVKNSIHINAASSRIWDALVNPEQTKKYMFGCEAISEWKKGSSLLWKGTYEGKEMIFVKGDIIDIQPEKYLAYTVIDPNNPNLEDKPENYLTVTITLSPGNSGTDLTVTQGDYNKVGDGPNRYKHTIDSGGWDPILVQIKKLVEEK